MGAVRSSSRSVDVLCSMYHVARPFALAFRQITLTNPQHPILGINVQSLTQMGCDARMMDADARAATVQTIAGHMEDALEIQREVNVRFEKQHLICR